ncbi:hypothetical protein SAMN05421767_102102 [Granulicatella balaenopterae]|uniref:Uncharacterized protein n=1 Tax=Granulicatella balaenopterae TaxID=137733 RepID=A0A1H9HHI2_9LACT|nr:hypothetical protein SAMN05421767_102102 [Granulicatella balaenopterae]
MDCLPLIGFLTVIVGMDGVIIALIGIAISKLRELEK